MRRLAPHEHPRIPRADVEAARVLEVPVLSAGISGMTLGRLILVRRGHAGDGPLLEHELVHVGQWRALGVVGFLRAYLADYLRGRRAGLGHWDAYRAIALETEARDFAGR